jgi:aspartyl/asparaginyl beta-hydroxylase (cupin superfamily)
MDMSAAEAEAAIRAGIAALQQGGAGEARRLFEQVVERGGPVPPPWFLLAQACRYLGDGAAEEAALDKALAGQPRNIGALVMKGDCRARGGDTRAAVSFYQSALKEAANAGQVSPMLAAELRRVEQFTVEAGGDFELHLEKHLAEAGVHQSARSSRFKAALDIMLNRKQIYLQQPNSFYFPGLPQIQFYERYEFPWLASIEAAGPAIRAELEAVLAEEGGFPPYIEANPNRPLPPNHLLGDPSWGAFHLWQGGEPVAGNAERCPRTMQALERAPIPRISGRSPMALFSLLKPGTHIKPHHGMLNTRLICHLPLLTAPKCRLRVGNEIRTWEEGKTLIFDDSFEHEAWNEGSGTRVVLLFEIWRPEISEDERVALTAMYEAITDYGGPGAVAQGEV